MKKLLESTFDVEPRMVEPDYVGMLSYFAAAQKGRALIVVLTDLTDPIGSHYLLSGLASLSGKHLPFCVTLKDRQITQVANLRHGEEAKKEEIVNSIYRRAVATDLLSQRELALSVLQRRGCLILDAPPQELSDKLVDAYLDVNRREIARRAKLSRTTVQNAFSKKGNPTIRTIAQIVHEAVA